jgi:hypothetical protein
MNPQILQGVDKVLLNTSNEIRYLEDVFPLIQVGPTHILVDEGDNLVDPKLGHHPAVAVERRASNDFAVLIAGDVALDTKETVGGKVDGFSENQCLLERLIDHLSESIDSSERRTLKAYTQFEQLEKHLGELIATVLGVKTGKDNIFNLFPETVQNRMKREGGDTPDYSLANFDELIKILFHNWDAFYSLFESKSKSRIRNPLERINHGVRRYLAHPHKAKAQGYKISYEDIALLESMQKRVRSALERNGNLGNTG